MNRILVVEDEQSISDLISDNLKAEGYHITCAMDGEVGADYIEAEQFDLVLLDIMLPKVNGYELMEFIRPTGIPVIFITAKGRTEERIKGLKMGADDYLVKPFQIGELIARVEAVLRRAGKLEQQLVFEDIVVNISSRQVTKEGRPVELTIKEFALLVELIKNKNIALYRDQLYERVWEEPFTGETRTLDSHIQHLRKKLGLEEKIRTIFRIGYRLED